MSVQDHPKKTVLAVAACTLAIILLMRPAKYGEVNELTYEIGSALYSACNRQDTPRLESIEKCIKSGAGNSDLSTQEAQWLTEILQLAQQGGWAKARSKARRLMEDQVRYP